MCLPLKDQHLLTISAPAMVEFEVQVTCCSQTDSWIVTSDSISVAGNGCQATCSAVGSKEWETAPAFEEYRQRLRFDRWLMVPPLFSPATRTYGNHSHTSGRFKSYRSGGSRIILRARSLLMTFIIFDKSSCIIFAVVRSTLLLWHFLLHSLFFS